MCRVRWAQYKTEHYVCALSIRVAEVRMLWAGWIFIGSPSAPPVLFTQGLYKCLALFHTNMFNMWFL